MDLSREQILATLVGRVSSEAYGRHHGEDIRLLQSSSAHDIFCSVCPILYGTKRCGRDFSKLVERIADQKRFEEEQRVARAAERVGSGGEAGLTEASADSSGRKPKGLVWEVMFDDSAVLSRPSLVEMTPCSR